MQFKPTLLTAGATIDIVLDVTGRTNKFKSNDSSNFIDTFSDFCMFIASFGTELHL